MAALGTPELDRELHDARLTIDSIRRVGQDLLIAGSIERPTSDRPPRAARYEIQLRLFDVDDFEVQDDEELGALLIEEVVYDSTTGILRLESAVPGRLLVRTRHPAGALQVDQQPSAVRRWGRWRAVDDTC